MNRVRIIRDDLTEASERVEAWLMQKEAEYNLLLSLLPSIRSRKSSDDYLATIEVDGEVAGCAFRTPPFKLGLTELPLLAIPPLIEDLASVYADLPSLFGPENVAVEFANQWGQRTNTDWATSARQRIHRLDELRAPARMAEGSLRAATGADLPLLLDWASDFARATATDGVGRRERTLSLFEEGAFYFWEDSQPRSMLAALGGTARGIRVGYVYTPEHWRGRGYATTAVAALSRELLQSGREFCILYTDLANPTSNGIYAALGYKPVCDVVELSPVTGLGGV